MAENSKIEWCHHTFNPWVGCTRLSPACDHCYAEGWAKRTGQTHLWKGERRRTSASNWRQPLKWNRTAAKAGERPRVFCASLADVFDNQVPEIWRSDLFGLIEDTPALDWMLLTKRPQNILKMIWPKWDKGLPGNIWLGTTVEDRERLRNVEHLRAVPASVRFLSIEPLLEDLGEIDLTGIHLVIVGGESGSGARPMNPAWVRSIQSQCVAAGVAFFFKQWGDWADASTARIVQHGPVMGRKGDVADWMHRSVTFEDGRSSRLRAHSFTPHATDLVFRVGKKAAGRSLDGRAHDAMPRPLTPES